MRSAYLFVRRQVRSLVTRHPRVDMAIGHALVSLDVWFRKLGLVDLRQQGGVLEHRGLRLHFDEANKDLAETVATTGEYEPETVDAVIGSLSPGDSFVDLGANIGLFTVLAARQVGSTGHVYAFEPTPATARLLRANVRGNGVEPQVTVEELAVSNQQGTTRFVLMDSAQANAVAVDGDTGGKTVEVGLTSLDAYFAARAWPAIRLIKMDVEGQEINVLDGMRELVRRNPCLQIVFEYNRGQLDRTRLEGRRLIETAIDLGFAEFQTLFRRAEPISLPSEMARLDRLAARANVNILARRL